MGKVESVATAGEVIQVQDQYYILASSALADHRTRVLKAGETFVKRGEDVDPKDGQTTPLTAPNDIPYPQLHDGCECGIAPG